MVHGAVENFQIHNLEKSQMFNHTNSLVNIVNHFYSNFYLSIAVVYNSKVFIVDRLKASKTIKLHLKIK